jgi:hypothetical protein
MARVDTAPDTIFFPGFTVGDNPISEVRKEVLGLEV